MKFNFLGAFVDGDTFKEISRNTGRSYMSVYTHMQVLAEEGLVEFKTGYKCNRRLQVYLTYKGADRLSKIFKKIYKGQKVNIKIGNGMW